MVIVLLGNYKILIQNLSMSLTNYYIKLLEIFISSVLVSVVILLFGDFFFSDTIYSYVKHTFIVKNKGSGMRVSKRKCCCFSPVHHPYGWGMRAPRDSFFF